MSVTITQRSSSGSSPANLNVVSIDNTDSPYSILLSDDVILVDTSGGAVTATLPTAVGNSGKLYRLKKVSNDFTAVTIDTTSAQTIDGVVSTTLNTQYEEITLISDGANWDLLNRDYPQSLLAYTPTLTGFGTPTSVGFFYQRQGDSIYIVGGFVSGTPTAVEARASLPAGLTSKSTEIPAIRLIGDTGTTGSAAAFIGTLIEASVGYVTFGLQSALTNVLTKANADTIVANGQSVSINALVPIAGWN